MGAFFYIATASDGVQAFRSSPRTYTHAVMLPGSAERLREALEALAAARALPDDQEAVEAARARLERSEALPTSAWTADECDRRNEARHVINRRRELRVQDAEGRVIRAGTQALAWCGRRDLADRAAAKCPRTAEIVPAVAVSRQEWNRAKRDDLARRRLRLAAGQGGA